MTEVRLDKWLWAARFYKTRSLARQMIEGGKVEVDGQRGRPARAVRVGQLIELRQGQDVRVVRVTGLAEKRGSAADAAGLYEETAESVQRREEAAATRRALAHTDPTPDHRPDKKERRDLVRFRRRQAP